MRLRMVIMTRFSAQKEWRQIIIIIIIKLVQWRK